MRDGHRAIAGVATSDPRATDAAIDVLLGGGNAVDAAVTAAFVLFVVEPQSCGVGGDAFVIISDGDGDPLAYDGSGALPAELTTDRLRADGFDGVPPRGGASTSVPGAVALLDTVMRSHGTLRSGVVAGPAVALAENGFDVRPSLADAARRAAAEIGPDPVLGPLYVPDGRAVNVGETVRNPALAACLRELAVSGPVALYQGELAQALVETVRRDGGYLGLDDLAAHETLPMAVESIEFMGHRVWELPLPTQGPAVLHALAALQRTPALEPPVDWATVVEATRTGMAATGFDPSAMGPRQVPAKGDTTYLAVVDEHGLAVSLITSVFGDFGSHLGVAGLGGPVHNRATTLRMLRRSPTPGKPPHTTIPALVTGPDGRPTHCLGVAGGIMQPQAQVQLLVRMLCEGLGAQAAIEAARFKICFGGDLALEAGHPLAARFPAGLSRSAGPEGFGSAQVVSVGVNGVTAAADRRRGGSARVIQR